MPSTYGPEEFGIAYPTFKGGEPDRVLAYQNASMNTLEAAERERQIWIDRGEDALVVSRQWKVL